MTEVHDAATLMRLAQARRDAFDALAEWSSDAPWPSSFEDPFPETETLPEVQAADLSVPLLGGSLAHHGCLLVRGFLDADISAHMCELVDRAFEGFHRARAGATREETAPDYARMPPHPKYPARHEIMRTAPGLSRLVMADCPRAMFEVTRALDARGWPDLLREYLGGPLAMTENKWGLYRMPPRSSYQPLWHQEVSVLPPIPIRTVNCWTAFSHCGRDAPGLRVVPKRIDEVLPTARGYYLNAEVVTQAIGTSNPAMPEFRPGDAVLFDQMALHGSFFAPGMTRNRYAMEAWFFRPDGHPRALGGIAY